ncbi:MAG: DUF444 family protein [Syntrophobacteraceae bacterium]|jgi:uncharacterized sporulation protein YeaH/YhbH (DUF444 family)
MEKDIPETEGQAHGNALKEEGGAKSLSYMAGECIYGRGDMVWLQDAAMPGSNYVHSLSAIDDLLERDKLREKDGFPRKIRIGRLVKPGRGGKGKIILVPTTVEEKFIHDVRHSEPGGEGESSGGTGEGQEGEVIGEEPVHGAEGSGTGAGQGEEAGHEIESSAYDLGRILSEKFELPELKDKGKKQSLTRYTYDLTDRQKGAGQFLDKKATLRNIIETNLGLNRISSWEDIDPTGLLVAPRDKVYRILSREKDYDSQAMVFFIRDYSGSMSGKPTEVVVTQHILIYSWLLYQYEKRVESRFILHDTEAKEVSDFYTYYSSNVAGGTRVASAYRLVNQIVETESLANDYNIYVLQGTDGDDWDSDGSETIPEIQKVLAFTNRVGITIAGTSEQTGGTVVERYLTNSHLLEEHARNIRMDSVGENATELRLIEGMKKLLS